MLSSRMLGLIEYMQKHPQTAYKTIAADLNLKERSVRYDIDRINEMLGAQGLSPIEKRPKGVLIYPEGLEPGMLLSDTEFIFSTQERLDFMLLTLLIRKEDFKINALAREFQVARSTVKNDVAHMQTRLEAEGLNIAYENGFFLEGVKTQRSALLNKEFKKYLGMIISPPEIPTAFEQASLSVIQKAFAPVVPADIIACIDRMLEANGTILSDVSYKWYCCSVLVLMWYIINDKTYPLSPGPGLPEPSAALDGFIQSLEALAGKKISTRDAGILARFLDFTNKFAHFYNDVDLIDADDVAYKLIDAMSEALHLPFEKDAILVDGMISHMIPLLQRIQHHVVLDDKMASIIGDNERPVLLKLTELCHGIVPLDRIQSDDEYVYLVMYFLAGIRRMEQEPPKRVLLVCGHGYGTTTMLKEKLLSEYQIQIVETLPAYRLSGLTDWTGVDAVIATTNIDRPLPVPTAVVNPLPDEEDYLAIEKIGISHKRILSQLFAIEQKLDFLNPMDKKRVLEVIERELGYQSVMRTAQSRDLGRLLKYTNIRIADAPADWHDIVRQAGEILVDQGNITPDYIQTVITGIEELGFYSVTDGMFAILHGKACEGVLRTGMSLMVTKTPTAFGDKHVRVIFFLAPKNTKDHLPAIITLTRMIKNTTLLKDLEEAGSVDEIYQSIIAHEVEVK